ncbi:hypothetical protein LINPERPRIM_LOCUS25598 [Linum perenne]
MASSSSFFTTKVPTILLLLIIIVIASTVECSADDIAQCNSTMPVNDGACKDYYGYCVTSVITALRTVTPSMGNNVYSNSYPEEGASGGVTGSAACVYPNSIQTCQICFRNAKEFLDSCTAYASGEYVTSVCTMYFRQIP